MKRLIFAILCAAIIPLRGMAQHDRDNYNQWASMEFKQWGFTPESYYYSWYKKKINMGLFHITVKVPGLGVHDKGPAGMFGGDNYVNERWRQMAGLRTKATASHSVESGNAGKEDGHWNDVFKQDLLTIADRNVEVSYTKKKKKREKLLDDVMNNILVLERNNEDVSPFLLECRRIIGNVENIHKASMDNSKKLVAYQRENESLEQLAAQTNCMAKILELDRVVRPEQYNENQKGGTK